MSIISDKILFWTWWSFSIGGETKNEFCW